MHFAQNNYFLCWLATWPKVCSKILQRSVLFLLLHREIKHFRLIALIRLFARVWARARAIVRLSWKSLAFTYCLPSMVCTYQLHLQWLSLLLHNHCQKYPQLYPQHRQHSKSPIKNEKKTVILSNSYVNRSHTSGDNNIDPNKTTPTTTTSTYIQQQHQQERSSIYRLHVIINSCKPCMNIVVIRKW